MTYKLAAQKATEDKIFSHYGIEEGGIVPLGTIDATDQVKTRPSIGQGPPSLFDTRLSKIGKASVNYCGCSLLVSKKSKKKYSTYKRSYLEYCRLIILDYLMICKA